MPENAPAPPLKLLLGAGWDDAWARAAMPSGPQPDAESVEVAHPLSPGRVLRADRGASEVVLDEGTVTAAWGPTLRRAVEADPVETPVAGDWVLVDPGGHCGCVEAVLVEVLPRRTAVVRLQAGRSSRGQVLAANADLVCVVEGLHPDPDTGRIERLLALAWASGATPAVVLTKADLVPDPRGVVQEVTGSAPGCPVWAVSTVDGSGLDPLRTVLSQGQTVALLGASGVGKSTLLNTLVGSEAMRTRALATVGKGRHTTVTRELHLVPGGGAVLDTPGMRSVGLLGGEDLVEVFPEVEELAADCRFDDCAHRVEPGCAVLAAVEDGTLSERRLRSYRKLLRELEFQASRVDARVAAQRAGRWRAVHREQRSRRRIAP